MQWEVPSAPDLPDGRFVVVAAHLSGDCWVEVRRYDRVKRPVGATKELRTVAGDDLRLPTADELWPDRPDTADDSFTLR